MLSSPNFYREKLVHLVKNLSKSPTCFVKSSKENFFAQI